MIEFFEFLKHLETPFSRAAPREGPIHKAPFRDKVFKTVILALLLLSITIQVLASKWFCHKVKIFQDRLSLNPVAKPVQVDLNVTLPELVELHQRIDIFTQELDKGLKTHQAISVPEGNTGEEIPSTPARKEAKPRRSNRVVVVEDVKN